MRLYKIAGIIFKGIQAINNKLNELKSINMEIKYGDVLGVDRAFYEHYAIYVGDDQVIHYTNSNEQERLVLEIRKTHIKHFLDDAATFFILDFEGKKPLKSLPIKYMRNKRFLKRFYVYTPEETVKRAESRIGEKEYDLINNNCEHFAIWCKTGLNKSYQVEEFMANIPKIMQRVP